MSDTTDPLLRLRARWRLRARLDQRRRLIGRYCCPDAALLGRTNCGRHPNAELADLLVAHGLKPEDLSAPGGCCHERAPARLFLLSRAGDAAGPDASADLQQTQRQSPGRAGTEEAMTTLNSPFADYVDLIRAAERLGIHPHSARRLIKQGVLPFELHFGKYLIRRETLDQIASHYDPRPGRKRGLRLL